MDHTMICIYVVYGVFECFYVVHVMSLSYALLWGLCDLRLCACCTGNLYMSTATPPNQMQYFSIINAEWIILSWSVSMNWTFIWITFASGVGFFLLFGIHNGVRERDMDTCGATTIHYHELLFSLPVLYSNLCVEVDKCSKLYHNYAILYFGLGLWGEWRISDHTEDKL